MIKKTLIIIRKMTNNFKLKRKYRKNKTIIESYYVSNDVKLGINCHIGKKVYISQKCSIDNYSYINSRFNFSIIESNTIIGKFCSIGDSVIIGLGSHNYNYISTHPFLYDKNFYKKFKKRPIPKIATSALNDKDDQTLIENDVWIGANVNIKRGVTIGDGAVIGMNAVVTKDIPPYAIVVGIPAKIIGYRFSEEKIKYLLSIKWWNWNEKKIFDNIEKFYDINTFMKKEDVLMNEDCLINFKNQYNKTKENK